MNDAHLATEKVLKMEPGFLLSEYSKSQPYQNPQDLEKIISMLHKAGLPK
jgi:hypothetical protein